MFLKVWFTDCWCSPCGEAANVCLTLLAYLFFFNVYAVHIANLQTRFHHLFILHSSQPEGGIEVALPREGRTQNRGSLESKTGLPVSNPTKLPRDILPGPDSGLRGSSFRPLGVPQTEGREPTGCQQLTEPRHQHESGLRVADQAFR